MSIKIRENFETLLYTLLITLLPTLPTGRQAQAEISKDDCRVFGAFSEIS
jgi:hypothetical protein